MSTPPDQQSELSGIEPEAQEAAKLAARKAGLSLTEWLSQTIRSTATQELKRSGDRTGETSSSAGAAPEPPEAAPQGNAPYGGAAGYGPPPPGYGAPPPPYGNPYGPAPGYGTPYPPTNSAGYAPPPPPEGTAPPPAPTIQAIYDSIRRLVARVEEMESRAADNIAPIAQRVAEITEKLENANDAKSASVAPVERAVVRLAERLEELENQNREPERRSLFGRRSKRR